MFGFIACCVCNIKHELLLPSFLWDYNLGMKEMKDKVAIRRKWFCMKITIPQALCLCVHVTEPMAGATGCSNVGKRFNSGQDVYGSTCQCVGNMFV